MCRRCLRGRRSHGRCLPQQCIEDGFAFADPDLPTTLRELDLEGRAVGPVGGLGLGRKAFDVEFHVRSCVAELLDRGEQRFGTTAIDGCTHALVIERVGERQQSVLVLGPHCHPVAVLVDEILGEGHPLARTPTVEQRPLRAGVVDLRDHRDQRRDPDAAGNEQI